MTALRLSYVLAAIFLAPATASAGGAQFVSYHFDGLYQRGASLAAGEFDADCRDLPLAGIEIRDGALRAYEFGRQTVKGLVFESGYFNADFYFPNGEMSAFEGKIDSDGLLTGGVINGGCQWVIQLQRISRKADAPQS